MESKMTAVEWLEKNIGLDMSPFELIKCFDKAKEMEKQQMENVARDWWREGADYVSDVKREYVSFDKYYKMKFEKGGEK